MAEATIKNMLKEFGLTDTESEVYLFLSKYGASKGTQIAKQTKKDKAQIYHALKSLVAKGLAESTLESPVRFTPVAFENVVESAIKAKQEEAAKIQNTKQELLDYWKTLNKEEKAISIEKFMVIEGTKRINDKISQMIKNATNQLLTNVSFKDFLRAEKIGLYDVAFNHPLKSKIQFRFLTDIQDIDLKKSIRLFNKFKKMGFNFRGKNPELGQSLFPQLIIRDDEEALFFIRPNGPLHSELRDDVCIWTNCKSLVQAFTVAFEQLWQNSTNIQNKLVKVRAETALPMTHAFNTPEEALKKYNRSIQSALKEVTILASSQTLHDISKQSKLLNEWAKKQVSVRMMAPITRGAVGSVKQLLKYCQIKHVPIGAMGTTIVDRKELFQFDNPPYEINQPNPKYFENAFYSNNIEYVEKANKMLDDMWINAQDPHVIISESSNTSNESEILAENNPYGKLIGIKVIDAKPLTEKEILEEILEARRLYVKNPGKDTHKIFATGGSAIIRPPTYLNLPDLMIEMAQVESQSSLGPANVLSVYQWLNTGKDVGYAMVAMVYTTPKPWAAAKQLYKDTLAGDNIQLVKEDELQMRVHGNIMFAGWTIPIPLLPRKCILPPACLTLEGYGKVHPTEYTLLSYYGAKSLVKQNCFDAFVTFMHPNSKYSGAGTDGFFSRDYIMTLQPPV